MSAQKVCWLCGKYIDNYDEKKIVENIMDKGWLRNAIENKIKKAKEIIPLNDY